MAKELIKKLIKYFSEPDDAPVIKRTDEPKLETDTNIQANNASPADRFDDDGIGAKRIIPAPDKSLRKTKPHRIVLFVKAAEGEKIEGKALFQKLMSAHFKPNNKSHYECTSNVQSVDNRPIFSIANLSDDGKFELNQLAFNRYNGIVFMMDLPGPRNARSAFSTMIKHVEEFALTFNAHVLDEKMKVLTKAKLQEIQKTTSQY